MATINWRTINIDALDPDSPANFDLKTLTPAVAPVSTAEVQNLASQIRQLLRGGDSEGALRGALETTPYGADERGKVDAPTANIRTWLQDTLTIKHSLDCCSVEAKYRSLKQAADSYLYSIGTALSHRH